MKINISCKVEKAISKDQTRHAITAPWLTVDSKVIATDGKILAVIPCEVNEGDAPGYIPTDALKASRKGRGATGEMVLTRAECQVLNGATFPVDNERTAPDWTAVIPPADRPIKMRVALDPERLAALAEAMGAGAVVLEIEDESSPITVRPASKGYGDVPAEPGAFGVIMPCRFI